MEIDQANWSQFARALEAKFKKIKERDDALEVKNGKCPFTFTLDPYEYEQYLEWERTHKCQFNTPTPENPFPSGAIGGETTLEFGFTSLGTAVTIKCACGEEKNITNYDLW